MYRFNAATLEKPNTARILQLPQLTTINVPPANAQQQTDALPNRRSERCN